MRYAPGGPPARSFTDGRSDHAVSHHAILTTLFLTTLFPTTRSLATGP